MSRLCGICLLSPREGDPMGTIRLHPDDVEGEHVIDGGKDRPLTPGAYQACSECLRKFAPVVSERLQRTQAIDDAGHKLFRAANGDVVYDSAQGEPVMVLSPGASAHGHMLL